MSQVALLALLACVPAPTPGGEGQGSGVHTDGATTSSDGGASDTAAPTAACPDGMVPVPADAPEWCIDAYEGKVEDGLVHSGPGWLPTVGLTFDQAVEACAATPVLDASGEVVGAKRLATLDEWRDAADGQVGDGGWPFPYGETWVDGLCATPDLDGTVPWEGLLDTGSLPDCVSPFGVYDTLGNAWEWADPGIRLDIEGWLAARAAAGLVLSAEEDGLLFLDEGDSSGLHVQMAGLYNEGVAPTGDGSLAVLGADLQAGTGFVYAGYLWQEGTLSEELLPVALSADEVVAGGTLHLYLRWGEDGAPVPAKVGCAWYAGSGDGCASGRAALEHTHDFDGTIGLRCAADPLPGG